MLKGLWMRRQSSQVSTSGTASQPSLALEDDSSPLGSPVIVEPSSLPEPLYGDTAQDAGDEVRFSVELTRLDRLNDTLSLDIRRLKGNLRSYKFLYDTLRECVAFSLSSSGSLTLIDLLSSGELTLDDRSPKR